MTSALLELLARGARPLTPPPTPGELPSPEELFDGVTSLVVVDLEMSGPNPLVHEVLDIGGVRARLAPGFPEEESWGGRIKPLRIGNAEPGALRVVRYNSKDWRNAITLKEAFQHITRIGEGAVFTGWGIGQDLIFLAQTFQVLGLPWPFAPTVLDVQPIARHLLRGTGNVDRFNLGHVADRLGIGRMGEHGALPDAYATYDVLVKLLELPPPPA